jgi:hypothetical protein
MIDISTFAEPVPLPIAPAGWFDYIYAALADGRLAIVRTRRDVHAESRREWEMRERGIATLHAPKLWPEEHRLSIFDGERESDVTTVPSGFFSKFDRMPDGRWLVASSRAVAGERNGRIYAPDGTEEAALILGDAIDHLYCSPDGTIWLGYFDEGIFGLSEGGIVQLERSGAVLWSFNEQVDPSQIVDDCYALTLAGSIPWACYYSDFPIARIDGQRIRIWSNEVAGAKAIAVSGDLILLAGGYDEDAARIALVQLEGDHSHHIASLRFTPPPLREPGLLQGRDGRLHIVSNGAWTRLSIHRAAQVVGHRP